MWHAPGGAPGESSHDENPANGSLAQERAGAMKVVGNEGNASTPATPPDFRGPHVHGNERVDDAFLSREHDDGTEKIDSAWGVVNESGAREGGRLHAYQVSEKTHQDAHGTPAPAFRWGGFLRCFSLGYFPDEHAFECIDSRFIDFSAGLCASGARTHHL